jgi:hypothetical protein
MAAAYPDGEYENWAVCQALLPHVQSVTERQPSQGQSADWTQVLTSAGWYTWRQGLLQQAEDFINMSLKECEERFGVDHFRTLLNVGILGSILTDGGKYSEAGDEPAGAGGERKGAWVEPSLDADERILSRTPPGSNRASRRGHSLV